MKLFLTLLLPVYVLSGSVGTYTRPNQRIVDGEDVDIADFPWQVTNSICFLIYQFIYLTLLLPIYSFVYTFIYLFINSIIFCIFILYLLLPPSPLRSLLIDCILAFLLQGSYRTASTFHTCGCVFVGGRYVLTAGHCGGTT